VMRCRWAMTYPWRGPFAEEQGLFSGNPWSHVEIDLETGSFAERENPLPTPESLYSMCDPEWMLSHLRDDLALQLAVFAGDPDYGDAGLISDLDRPRIGRLAEALDFSFDWSGDLQQQAAMLLNRYGQRATIFILDQAAAFAASAGKTLLFVLNFTARPDSFLGATGAWDGRRRDQEILDHLSAGTVPVFDMNEVHQREYEQASGSYHEYLRRYLVGDDIHYNPSGNHFFAFALKDRLLELLEPKPMPYQDLAPGSVDLSVYLPGA
jgi:hypothetical protein